MNKRIFTIVLLLVLLQQTRAAFAETDIEREARYNAMRIPWSTVQAMDEIHAVSEHEQRLVREQIKSVTKQIAAGSGNRLELRRLKLQLKNMQLTEEQRINALLTPDQRRRLEASTPSAKPTAVPRAQPAVGIKQGGIWDSETVAPRASVADPPTMDAAFITAARKVRPEIWTQHIPNEAKLHAVLTVYARELRSRTKLLKDVTVPVENRWVYELHQQYARIRTQQPDRVMDSAIRHRRVLIQFAGAHVVNTWESLLPR